MTKSRAAPIAGLIALAGLWTLRADRARQAVIAERDDDRSGVLGAQEAT